VTDEEMDRLESIYERAFGRPLLPEEKRFLGLTRFLGRTYTSEEKALDTHALKPRKIG
jgi:hypothetical protein